MINRVVLVGRLTRDPELRVSQSNVAVANFNLAVNRPFTGKDGERGADFINIICFRKIAENVNQYVKKVVWLELMAEFKRVIMRIRKANVYMSQKSLRSPFSSWSPKVAATISKIRMLMGIHACSNNRIKRPDRRKCMKKIRLRITVVQ